jgi:hypothetical protein
MNFASRNVCHGASNETFNITLNLKYSVQDKINTAYSLRPYDLVILDLF